MRILGLILLLTALSFGGVAVFTEDGPPTHCPGQYPHTIPPGWAQNGPGPSP